MQINYIERSNIKDALWNKCIDESVNGIIYAYTWYLDIVSPNWSALIADDYSYIFPLPVHKRFGVEMLSQPLFTQQLGLFSPNHITPGIIAEFLEKIPPKYKYINIHLNTINKVNGDNHTSERLTYHLDLASNYTQILSKFNRRTRRNIIKSHALGIVVTNDLNPKNFLELFRINSKVKFSSSKFKQIEGLVSLLVGQGKGQILAAQIDGRLCAAAFVVKNNGKLVFLFSFSTDEGYQSRAMFAIVDQLICGNAESYLVLDFEGSMIPSIAYFFGGFGAKPCVYQKYIKNQLPIHINLLFSLKSLLNRYLLKV